MRRATLRWSEGRFAGSVRLRAAERLAYWKLMEKYQEFNPFKFIIYSGRSGTPVPQMEPDGSGEAPL